ncbi:MAG TPA: hypothetical protein VNN62_05905 [Methylomirabilota bacterium]|jgi:hypothetical protein|nr:hypothetical protein [Methylomirabilota bacterium]
MEMFRQGDHAGMMGLAEEYRKNCSPEGRFAHYLMMVDAPGEDAFRSPGVQYGAYEAALGASQAIVWFDV